MLKWIYNQMIMAVGAQTRMQQCVGAFSRPGLHFVCAALGKQLHAAFCVSAAAA